MIKHVAGRSAAEVIDWYVGLGVEFEVGQCYGTPIHYAHRALNPDGSGKSGCNIFNKTYPAFLAAGGTCLLNTRATELLQDESGAITGVKATCGPCTYTISCPAVVLAAGGYEGDAELLSQWSPHCGIQMVDTLCHVGDTGDGIKMGLAAGSYFVGTGYGQTTAAYNPLPAIKVTADGVRYCNETHSEEGLDQGHQFKAFYDSGSQWTYTLFDSSTLDENAAAEFEKAQKRGDVYEGDTLEAVAEAAGVDPAGLVATVERWNEMVAAGVDEDFGCEQLAEIGTYEDGPFFLVPYTMVINGTVGGLKDRRRLAGPARGRLGHRGPLCRRRDLQRRVLLPPLPVGRRLAAVWLGDGQDRRCQRRQAGGREGLRLLRAWGADIGALVAPESGWVVAHNPVILPLQNKPSTCGYALFQQVDGLIV